MSNFVKLKKYNVEYVEIVRYEDTEVEAVSEEEAFEVFMKMFNAGEVDELETYTESITFEEIKRK